MHCPTFPPLDATALARARAAVDVTTRNGADFSAREAALNWQHLKQARGQTTRLAALHPHHIIGQPAADVSLSNVAQIDATRLRVADRIRAMISAAGPHQDGAA